MDNYSQNNEQEIILNYFGDTKGTFLDLGANDGKTLSNTYALTQMGWGGVLVEASPRAFNRLYETFPLDHRNLIFINKAVAAFDGDLILHESGELLKQGDVGLVSSAKSDEVKRWGDVSFMDIPVKCCTIKTLLAMCPAYKQFEFINIDIEGMELDVLPQIDFDALGTQLICAEWNSKNKEKFDAIILPFGFQLINQNAENLIYAKPKAGMSVVGATATTENSDSNDLQDVQSLVTSSGQIYVPLDRTSFKLLQTHFKGMRPLAAFSSISSVDLLLEKINNPTTELQQVFSSGKELVFLQEFTAKDRNNQTFFESVKAAIFPKVSGKKTFITINRCQHEYAEAFNSHFEANINATMNNGDQVQFEKTLSQNLRSYEHTKRYFDPYFREQIQIAAPIADPQQQNTGPVTALPASPADNGSAESPNFNFSSEGDALEFLSKLAIRSLKREKLEKLIEILQSNI